MRELSDRKHEDEVKRAPWRRQWYHPLATQQSLGVQSLDHGFPHHSLTGGWVDPIPVELNPIIYPRTQRAFDVSAMIADHRNARYEAINDPRFPGPA